MLDFGFKIEDNDILGLLFSEDSVIRLDYKKDKTIGINNGRHHICAAYKFNVPALPVRASLY